MANDEIAALQKQIMELNLKLHDLQKQASGTLVKPYIFKSIEGEVTLSELFGRHDKLLAIHNMGQACRYCTLWGDGISGLLPHLESVMSVVVVSKDPPDTQRKFASSRGWGMRMVSHGGGKYMDEQVAAEGMSNMPGAVVYEKQGDSIFRKSSTWFGPGDSFCAQWHFLGLAGVGLADWTPQYSYWQRPSAMEDGGENVLAPTSE